MSGRVREMNEGLMALFQVARTRGEGKLIVLRVVVAYRAASGKFELERQCADKRVNTWCDVECSIFVVLYSGDDPHADPQIALSR